MGVLTHAGICVPCLLPHYSRFPWCNTQRKGARRSTIDFRDPKACAALTTALLARDFDICWDLPPGHLIPPLTGRSNYIHWLEDLLELSSPGNGTSIRGLDIGTGANLIYPLLGARLCGWSFVGADVNQAALEAAGKLRDANPDLSDLIELRRVDMQPEQQSFFANDPGAALEPAAALNGPSRAGTGILSSALLAEEPGFAFSMCNPPFFESMEEAGANPATGFEGTDLEMVYPGGEAAFVRSMARDSTTVSQRVHWFTTMVGKKATLKSLRASLQTLGVRSLRTTEFAQGRTSRWAVAWSWMAGTDTATKPLSRGLPPAKRMAMLAPNQRHYSMEIVGSVAETWKHLQAAVGRAAIGLVEPAESYAVRVHLANSSEEGRQRKRTRTESIDVSVNFQIYQYQPKSQTVVATLEGDAAGDTFKTFTALVKNIFDSFLSQE